MKKRVLSFVFTMMLTMTSTIGLLPVSTFATEEVEIVSEDAVDESTSENEASVSENEGENADEGGAGDIVMSGLPSNNGRVIAAAFPSSILPEGFHKSSCTYEGQNIEIAFMDNDYNGEVVLAYLADADGSNGDFYLCDINTANMTDFVKIDKGDGRYIVVLDPGDVIVAPTGFKRGTVEWNGKSIIAWSLPTEDDEDESKSSIEDSIVEAFAPVKIYAAGAGDMGTLDDLISGGGSSDDNQEAEVPEESQEVEDSSDESAEEAQATESHSVDDDAEDGSRIVSANPAEFILLYAIDETGTVGFYLYDTVGETYQRYVAVAGTDKETIEHYKNSSRIRLIIIAVLAVIIVVMIFVIVNLLIQGRDSYDDEDEDDDDDDEDEDDEEDERPRRGFFGRRKTDEDDEIDQMRRRVHSENEKRQNQKRKELNYLLDIEDDEDDDESEEQEEVVKPRPVRRPVRRPVVEVEDNEDEEDEDELEQELLARRTAAKRPMTREEERPFKNPDEMEKRPVRRTRRIAVDENDQDVVPTKKPVRRPPISDEGVDTPMRRVPKKAAEPKPQEAPKPKRKADVDIDDDFEFEFIDIN